MRVDEAMEHLIQEEEERLIDMARSRARPSTGSSRPA